jgi:Holliday junction resolvase RusA-like endonuclease
MSEAVYYYTASPELEHVITFVVRGIPMTKGSWRSVTNRATGKPVLIADNPDEEAWALAVAWSGRAAYKARPPRAGRMRVIAEFTMPPKAGRKNYNRDIDKLARSMLDALTKVIWLDDEQVDELICRKRRGNEPGATIIIEEFTA